MLHITRDHQLVREQELSLHIVGTAIMQSIKSEPGVDGWMDRLTDKWMNRWMN